MRATLQSVGAVFITGQAAIAGVAVVTGSAVLTALAEIALLSAVGVVTAAARYRAFRRRYDELRREAVQSTARQRLSDDVHDLIGHELSLIGLQAGVLEMSGDPDIARRGVAIRQRSAEAITILHDTLRRIDGEPEYDDLATIVAGFRDAGARVSLTGTDPWPTEIRHAAAMVIREGLTNAARHAPGCAVDIRLSSSHAVATVEVLTDLAADSDPPIADGRGIAAQRRRLAALGGDVTARTEEGVHRLTARVPLTARRPGTASPRPARRALVAVIREAAVPVTVTVAIILGFYSWSTANSTIGEVPPVSVGTPRAQAVRALPERQSPVRLIHAPAHPAEWECRVYSNGNFPLGMATVQVCLDANRVVRVTDLSDIPLL
ncbi:MAG: histidine kinase [Corynebacteriales bacterium]|nr:histidine kinase [Mycobacteriales bacterium]